MSYAGNTTGQLDRWVPEIWNSRMVSLAKKRSFWMDQIGMVGAGTPVVDYGDVEGKPGDLIHLPTTAFFTGNPVTADSTLVVGNEQLFTPDELQISLKMRRFITSWTDVAEDYSIINILPEALKNLSYQLADNMDEDIFITATASHTYNVYGGGVAADSSLASTDVFNVAACRQIRAKLGFNRALTLGNVAGGGAIYAIAAHPYNVYDLKADSTYQNHVQYAEIRGASNPLFTGNLPVVDGLMILENLNVPYGSSNTTASTTYDEDGVGSGTAHVTHMFAFGSEALAMAYKWRPRIVTAEEDAKTKKYMHATSIYGVRRLVEKSSLVGHYYATAV